MQKSTLVACIFDDADSALDAIHELRRSGFSDDQLGLVVRYDTDEQELNTLAREIISGLLGTASTSLLLALETHRDEPGTNTKAEQSQEKRTPGIIIGGVIGGTLGTVALLHLPEIGLIVTGGILTAILGDAIQGGFAANLLHMGIPAHHAHHYAHIFQAGCIIFMIKADEQQQEIQDILHYHRARNIEVH
ncbi:MAG: hypothetical protein H0V70_04655 [Ktedonobacteraceae bacterium]|nr:hypothetical protein [Ktedonobacteraceae bacterium]